MIEIAIATLLAALLSDEQRLTAGRLLEQAFEVPPGRVVHVRVVDPNAPTPRHLRFDPQIPSGWGGEDETCPRVCFATSISGALASIRIALQTLDRSTGMSTPKRIDIYTNAYPTMMGRPTPAAVPDAPAAGELWALQPIDLVYVRSFDPNLTETLACASDKAEDGMLLRDVGRPYQYPLPPVCDVDELIQITREAIAAKMAELQLSDILGAAALAASGVLEQPAPSPVPEHRPPAPKIGFDFSLEMLCADQERGGHHPAWEETLEAQDRLEILAPRFNIAVNVMRTDDKYSEHQDAYIYFDFDQLQAAKELAEASGLPGDILDLDYDNTLSNAQIESAKQFALEAYWTLGNGLD